MTKFIWLKSCLGHEYLFGKANLYNDETYCFYQKVNLEHMEVEIAECCRISQQYEANSLGISRKIFELDNCWVWLRFF